MITRAIEITGTGRLLRRERGFLVVCDHQKELARLPLDDLDIVMVATHGASCTSDLLNTLATSGVPFILCDHRFLPTSVLLPIEGHEYQSARIRAQADLTEPQRKRLWQQIVKAKILSQAQALEFCQGYCPPRLSQIARGVQSGDTGNAEGEAARLYWPLLFGERFRRDQDGKGVNILLNYGYTVLRAAVARAVFLAGLHPAFGLHHHNRRNTMPLVDDLMEPFRPLVDIVVHHMCRGDEPVPELDTSTKGLLTAVPRLDLQVSDCTSPVSECLLRLTRSLAEVCEGRKRCLDLPKCIKVATATRGADE